MSLPVNQASPSAANDAASASDEAKTTHPFAEDGRNSPAFLARIRRVQRFRRYSCAAFGLSLLTFSVAIFLFPANPESLSVPLTALALAVLASSLLVLVAALLTIIWTTLRIAWQRNRMNEAKGTILLNDIPRQAESAAARLNSRWAKACAISIIGMLALRWGMDSHTWPLTWRWLMSFLLFVAAIISAALSVKYGRRSRLEERRRRSKIVELHDLQEREFVLYLRSFTDDVAGSRVSGIGGLSMEEQFVRTVNQIGPVATIGSPGEAQPHAGAYRLYVDNTSWHQSVEQLLEKATLVIIRTGLSGGLHWEIERVARSVSPQRVLMVVDDRGEMQRCLECIRKVHSQVSPSVRLGWRRVCGIRGLLVFDEQWRVSKLRLRGRGIYAPRSCNFIEPGLARSLYPLFQTLDVEWPRPLIDWSWPVTTLMPSMFVLLVLGALVLRGLELVGRYSF